MPYIDISSYINALRNPLQGELKEIEIIPCGTTLHYASGGGGVIFKVRYREKIYAMKCFTSLSQDLHIGYQESGIIVKNRDTKFIPDYIYIPNALDITTWDEHFIAPVLLMEWIEGDTLNSLIAEYCYLKRKEELTKLTNRFIEFAHHVITSEIIHSDIKGDNIIVNENGFYLIDIDAITDTHQNRCSKNWLVSPWFSHPDTNYDSVYRDHYPIAIIIASLIVLESEPQLHERYSNGDNIIFTPSLLAIGNDPAFNAVKEMLYSNSIYSPLADYISSRNYPNRAIEDIIYNIMALRGVRDYQAYRSSAHSSIRRLTIIKSNAGLFGFCDDIGRVVIAPQYSDVKDFDEGVAAVCSNGKWIYIDENGCAISDNFFDFATSFKEGVAAVRVATKWGYIDKRGDYIIAPIFDCARSFKGGRAFVSNNEDSYYINKKGERVAPCQD